MDARSTARRRFGHSGILYEKSFVMYDRKTESLWVHVTGRAEAGPLKGKQLPFFPSTVTTWARWRASYPNTLVLPGRRRDGFMGTYDGLNQPADLGLAVVAASRASCTRSAISNGHGTRVSYRGQEYLTGDRKGYRTVAWTDGHAVYGFVSLLDGDALLECADRLRAERATQGRL
jgi:hypothetical protein